MFIFFSISGMPIASIKTCFSSLCALAISRGSKRESVADINENQAAGTDEMIARVGFDIILKLIFIIIYTI
jgi:hypothetical protein